MKLEFSKIKNLSRFDYSPELDTYLKSIGRGVIQNINSVKGFVENVKHGDVYSIKFHYDVVLVVLSSLTNKPFEYPMAIDEELFFTQKQEFDSEDVEYVDKDYIDLDEIIFSLIVTQIPITLHGPEDEYVKTDTYRVMSEEEYLNENNSNFGSPFDALKDINFDE